MLRNIAVDCGWGKLIFAQTYKSNKKVISDLNQEESDTRNIAFYSSDPHVLVAKMPQELFIDPSHTYRKKVRNDLKIQENKGVKIRAARFPEDLATINSIYTSQQALPLPESFNPPKGLHILVSEDKKTNHILGVCMWLDHVALFADPEKGSSLWALAVNPAATIPGIGLGLVNECLLRAKNNKNAFVDLSVIHSNHQAISLYEKLGFERVPVFAVKNKSRLNEKLFIGELPENTLNMRSRVILEGARRRGIAIKIINEKGFFELGLGGKRVRCYESLTDHIDAIGLKCCDNHRLTNVILKEEGVSVPVQEEYTSLPQAESFLSQHGNIVTKVLRGTKLNGTTVDISNFTELRYGIEKAKKYGDRVLLEESVSGSRYRFLIINFQVVSVLRVQEPFIVGTGKHTIRQLIRKVNRRISGQYDDMRIPIDKELRSCVRKEGANLDTVLPEGKQLVLRRYANPRLGEFLKEVPSEEFDSSFIVAAEKSAHVLGIPVLSVEMKIKGSDYWIIQANERPALTPPHAPEVVDQFLDFLFPQLSPS